MDCWYHEKRAAVGCCRSCLKGLCRECATDLGRGLACRDRCEDAVREVVETVEQSVRSRELLRSARGMWISIGIVSLLVGVGVAVWGLTLPYWRETALLGIPFLAIGGILLRTSRRRSAPAAS